MNNESSEFPNNFGVQVSTRAGALGPTNVFVEFEIPEIEQTIADRFEKQVARYPEKIAVRTPDSAITYDGLDKAANRVAWAILDRPERPDEPVALLFENGAPFVVASLAAMKAGTIQVPLESTFPETSLRYILEQSRARVVVTDSKNISLARQLSNIPTINIDELTDRYADTAPAHQLPPDATVAVAYTSGSTGQPKGIAWNHRGVLHAVMRHGPDHHVQSRPATNALRIAQWRNLLPGQSRSQRNRRAQRLDDMRTDYNIPLGSVGVPKLCRLVNRQREVSRPKIDFVVWRGGPSDRRRSL
jgi:acyl-CoA synthetase (AMP-forming)/AMP-acid ligase II